MISPFGKGGAPGINDGTAPAAGVVVQVRPIVEEGDSAELIWVIGTAVGLTDNRDTDIAGVFRLGAGALDEAGDEAGTAGDEADETWDEAEREEETTGS